MKRIDIIYKRLKDLSSKHGVTAGELAMDLGMSRANVSHDLNRLFNDKKLHKEGNKPVYYSVIKADETLETTCLDIYSKNNPSLYNGIEQAKAAVLYPPNGMHMFLLGETGSGKSVLAEHIYKYAVEIGKLTSEASFVIFNCADYANNSQLLVSQLFGVKKGSYTGADNDKEGLIEKANNGILFLDEVHRLPPEGQEMLFTFIDKGIFRRLGETESNRSANVLIICATTENPDSALLNTFLRRIPMRIKLPSLDERTLDERLTLISQFFQNESARLGKPVFVSINAMCSLMGYHCINNIGQLRTDIQLICAKAYSDFVSGRKEDIRIVSFDLPEHIKEGMLSDVHHRHIWSRITGISKEYCVFDSRMKQVDFEDNDNAENIYELIDNCLNEYTLRHLPEEHINNEMEKLIGSYFDKYTKVTGISDFNAISNFVGYEVISIVNNIITYSEERLKRHFGENIKCGLAIHIYNSISRVKKNKRIVNPQLNKIRKEYGREFTIALECLKFIDERFHVSMPFDEAGFLAMFLVLDQITYMKEKNVKVIVAAHGTATASSMVSMCATLLQMDYAIAFDISFNESSQKTYSRIKDYLRNKNEKSDVLLLVDMGSLSNIGLELQKELGINIRTIPLVSTLHVIEATRKASMGYPLDYVYQATININDLMSTGLISNSILNPSNKFFILTICTTGEGSAAAVKHLLEEKLMLDNSPCEIVPLKITDSDQIYSKCNTLEQMGRIICVVSSFKINLHIPQFGLNEIFEGEAIKKIQALIYQEEVFANISKTFNANLKNINSKTIFLDIRRFIENIEETMDCKLTDDALIGVICHIGYMLNRLKGGGQTDTFPGRDEHMQENNVLIAVIKNECNALNEKYELEISEDEICHISIFFNQDNFVKSD